MKREAKVLKKKDIDDDSVAKRSRQDGVGGAEGSPQNPVAEQSKSKIEDAFACYLCGCANFKTQFDATVHEISCDGRCNPYGPWKCSACGKVAFFNSKGFGSHRILCSQSAMKGASLSLRPDCMAASRGMLSDFNYLVTESIEMVEVAQDDMERFAKTQRKRTPQVGNVGIRCVYCAANGVQPPGSMSCPDNLQSLPHNIYNMAQRHLLSSCKKIPKHIQVQLNVTKKTSLSQSMQKNHIGLPVYCKKLAYMFSLADNGTKEGIQRAVGNT